MCMEIVDAIVACEIFRLKDKCKNVLLFCVSFAIQMERIQYSIWYVYWKSFVSASESSNIEYIEERERDKAQWEDLYIRSDSHWELNMSDMHALQSHY